MVLFLPKTPDLKFVHQVYIMHFRMNMVYVNYEWLLHFCVAPVGSPAKPSFMVEEPSPEVQRLMQQAKDYQRQMQRSDGSAPVRK